MAIVRAKGLNTRCKYEEDNRHPKPWRSRGCCWTRTAKDPSLGRSVAGPDGAVQFEPVEKELLQTLAVIGKEFPLGLVWRVTDRSEDELTPELAKLQFREFIYEKPAFPQSEYTFKHASPTRLRTNRY
jgi:hypothetical protein